MTSSAINSVLSATSALMSKLAAVNAASASLQTNNRLALIGNQITAQLNKKIAQLKAQSEDPTVGILQQQSTNLSSQYSTYSSAETQLGQNRSILADLSLQLSNAAVASQSGDATSFDAALQSSNDDVAALQVVPFAAGLLPDGVAPLKYAGLNIQPSSTYNLSTPAGQAQALADVQAAQAQIQQVTTMTSQNQQISASIQQALQTQMTAVSNQISDLQQTELTDAAAQIANLKQQSQMEFHIIEMNFGNSSNAASILTAKSAAAQAAAVSPGTALGIMVGSSGEFTLPIANVSVTPPTTSASSQSSSSTGSIVSTSA